jgi:predicted ATPase
LLLSLIGHLSGVRVNKLLLSEVKPAGLSSGGRARAAIRSISAAAVLWAMRTAATVWNGDEIMGRRARKASPGPFLMHLELLRERITNAKRFPYCLPAIRSIDKLPFHPKVTFFIGENGSGKSTLLEAVAVACGLNPEGGSRNFNFATRASHSRLDDALRLAKAPSHARDSFFLRAESFYNVATEVERLEKIVPGLLLAYGDKSLHNQSHGESFFALFQHRFRGCGLYLMDEPEAALSPLRQIQFLSILHDYCKRGSQFVIATHSPIIMAYPDAWIYVFSNKGIQQVPYQETEHYLVTRGFLSSPRSALAALFSDEDAKEESSATEDS